MHAGATLERVVYSLERDGARWPVARGNGRGAVQGSDRKRRPKGPTQYVASRSRASARAGVYDFRERSIMFGPVSDMVPSTPIFEMYPARPHHDGRVPRAPRHHACASSTSPCSCSTSRTSTSRPTSAKLDAGRLRHRPALAAALPRLGRGRARSSRSSTPTRRSSSAGCRRRYFHEELVDLRRVDYVDARRLDRGADARS